MHTAPCGASALLDIAAERGAPVSEGKAGTWTNLGILSSRQARYRRTGGFWMLRGFGA